MTEHRLHRQPFRSPCVWPQHCVLERVYFHQAKFFWQGQHMHTARLPASLSCTIEGLVYWSRLCACCPNHSTIFLSHRPN